MGRPFLRSNGSPTAGLVVGMTAVVVLVEVVRTVKLAILLTHDAMKRIASLSVTHTIVAVVKTVAVVVVVHAILRTASFVLVNPLY